VIHRFVEAERFERLYSLESGGDGETILCVGKYRHKNGQDILRDAMRYLDDGLTAHFVGSDTEYIRSGDGVESHGFLELDLFYGLMDRADLMVYPARVGAYPVVVLEALLSALLKMRYGSRIIVSWRAS
jgi:glycosyltransferase involved in cell wall biosynthesis